MSSWIALGRTAEGVVGYRLNDGVVDEPVRAAAEAEVLRALEGSECPVLRIGDGTASRLPAKILPETGGGVPALEQENPLDVISAWVRLWAAGVRADQPDWDGVICALHGDVMHWLHVSADEIVSAQSSVTPRLAVALGVADDQPDPEIVAESLSRPERLATLLRIAELRGRPDQALGALIGAELAAMRAYWLGQQVMVIGEGSLPKAYALAFQEQGVPCDIHAPNELMAPALLALSCVIG